MGIPLNNGRKRRRSYADYRPPNRNPRPGNDPFRILFYLGMIIVLGWVYFNRDQITADLRGAPVPLVSDAAADAASPEAAPLTVEEAATKGQEAYLAGSLPEAIQSYRIAAELAPNEPEYAYQVARLLVYDSALWYGERRERMLQDAYDASQDAILADPEDPRGYAIAAKVLDWQGRPEEGLNQIQLALEIDNQWAEAHSYLAEIQIDLQRWEQASETINTALSLDPQSPDVRRDYGYVLDSLGDYNAGLTQYEAALTLRPNLPYLQMAVARSYRVLGRPQDALNTLFDLSARQPDYPMIEFELGLTYETFLGDPVEALAHYERAIELDQNYAAPWVRIGTIRFNEGSWVQATPAFERAVALGTATPSIYYQLGLAYAFQGKCDQAMPALEQSLALGQGDQQVIDFVATGYEACGRPLPPGLQPSPTEEPSADAQAGA